MQLHLGFQSILDLRIVRQRQLDIVGSMPAQNRNHQLKLSLVQRIIEVVLQRQLGFQRILDLELVQQWQLDIFSKMLASALV